MRDAYLKKWHQDHDPKPGKEPVTEGFHYRGASWDEEKPHLWEILPGRAKPSASHRRHGLRPQRRAGLPHGQRILFPQSAVTWDAASNQIKS